MDSGLLDIRGGSASNVVPDHCEIYKKMGDCIMPREGVFARVIEPGTITVGDEMVIEKREGHFPWQAAVITLSDKGSAGQRKDESGPAIAKRLVDSGYDVVEELLIPDDERVLKQELMRLCDQRQLDLILTTGGTGCSPRNGRARNAQTARYGPCREHKRLLLCPLD